MSNTIEKFKSEVEAKWLPIFESWSSSTLEDENPRGTEWRRKGSPKVGEFKQLVKRVGILLPEEQGRFSLFIEKLDQLTNNVDFHVRYYEEALVKMRDLEPSRDLDAPSFSKSFWGRQHPFHTSSI